MGASSGLGAALARQLAREGYLLALLARREARLADICDQINQLGGDAQARYYPHNVTSFDEVPALFQRIAADLSGIDLVIYVAGTQAAMSEHEYDFEKDAAMVRVNTLGAMAWLGQAALYFERAQAGQIVAISSIAADRGRRANPAYNASKAALSTYVEGLRNRLSRYGVTVTTIKPGFMDTRLLENAQRTMWVISAEKAAEQIYTAIRRKKQTVFVPGRWRLVSLIIRHIPSVIFRRLSI
ncbi:MAG: SDR family NAD(P)-dependent oxidoreductase [Candidatus Promineifilaceae bacterium]|nr:SDR family NAD(P)-dependent oxidoreductase [Candidatus Promineifilaceae bacterium]